MSERRLCLIKSDSWIENVGGAPLDAFFGEVIGLETPYVMARAKAAILTVLLDLLVDLIDDGEVFLGHFHGIVLEVSAPFHHGIENVVHNIRRYKDESLLTDILAIVVNVIIPCFECVVYHSAAILHFLAVHCVALGGKLYGSVILPHRNREPSESVVGFGKVTHDRCAVEQRYLVARTFQRKLSFYDLFGFSEELLEKSRYSVFGEIVTDSVTDECELSGTKYIAVEYLPGQFDQRAASAVDCVCLIDPSAKVSIKSSKLIILPGETSDETVEKIKKYYINAVESREKDLSKLTEMVAVPCLLTREFMLVKSMLRSVKIFDISARRPVRLLA